MALTTGSRLGPYEALASIGAGGMGEVYRARDTKLNREVALKILPESFALDPERLARFRREAQVLASLNHPNIAAIYGFEESSDTHALVLELVEGPTLADRIGQAPIPVDEAIPIARQIAEALEAAHEQGIIHRDLKPANIKIRPDGTVKVLDFGLAKGLAGESTAGSSALLANSPTMTSPVLAMTGVGILLGTAPYMSPEQARGKAADKRSDVWAFGCVLFEMLTGKRAFEGDDVTDTLAAIVRGEPAWDALPPGMPAAMRRVVRTCLRKDPHWRPQHIGDVRLELSTGDDPADMAQAAPPVRSRRSTWIMLAGVAVASILGVVAGRFRDAPDPAAVVEFTIAPPSNASLQTVPAAGSGVASQIAVSPDGKHVVFVANDESGYRLWLRSLDRAEPRALSGTEGGAFPFWSPDSQSIAFFAAGKLKKMNLSGGPPTIVCDAVDGRGGTWNQDNVIVFTPSPRGVLQRVSAGGATAVDASALDEGYGETNHRFPSFLPDGRHFLFTAVVGTCCPAGKPAQIRIGALDSMESTVLLQEESAVTYSGGYILFNRDGTLMAQAFDPSARTLAGEPFRFVDGIGSEGSRYASVSASTNGVLVYGKGQTMPRSRLTWLDRTGRELGTVGDVDTYPNLALSPDERIIAATIRRGNPVNSDIYRIDTKTGAEERLTFDPGLDTTPIWSPDGQRLVFQGQRSGKVMLLEKTMVGTTSEDVLQDSAGGIIMPTGWSADSRYLIYTYTPLGGNNDIWILPLSGDRKPIPFLQTPAVETDGTFSPDGKWVAYSASESGQPQVLIEPFPRTGGKVQISQSGGTKPMWRQDGRELYFLSADLQFMSATIDVTNGLRRETPVALFPAPIEMGFIAGRQYAVSRDGQRFLVNMRERRTAAALTVVVNWMAAIGK